MTHLAHDGAEVTQKKCWRASLHCVTEKTQQPDGPSLQEAGWVSGFGERAAGRGGIAGGGFCAGGRGSDARTVDKAVLRDDGPAQGDLLGGFPPHKGLK